MMSAVSRIPNPDGDQDQSDGELSPDTASRRQLYDITSDSKTRHANTSFTRTNRILSNCCQSATYFVQTQCMVILVVVSMIVNVGMVGFVLVRDQQHHTDGSHSDSENGIDMTSASSRSLQSLSLTDPSGSPILSVLQSPEYISLSGEYQKLKQEQIQTISTMQEKMVQLTNNIASLTQTALIQQQQHQQQQQGNNCPVCPSALPSCPTCSICHSPSSPPIACDVSTRMAPNDLSLPTSGFDLQNHEISWDYCASPATSLTTNETIEFCPETSTNEQYFQLTFFDRPGAGSRTAVRKGRPVSPTCVQLPPLDYRWPSKHAPLPTPPGTSAVHWPNLRVANLTDLLVFNKGTPKNLYHFNASFYDLEQEEIINQTAAIIPFGKKVRLMLDVGAGGASLGLHLKRRYDVQTVSTVFADWPYCEYISERGNICMFIDAMEAMPFAKFTYDVVHASWVFHALYENQLRTTYLEQNRILRPGGYMWIKGGWSFSQVKTLEELLIEQLGYKVMWEAKRPVREPGKYRFDTVPFEVEWEAILVKPIKATCNGKDRMEDEKM